MKSLAEVEKLVKRFRIKPTVKMSEKTLADALKAQDEIKKTESTAIQPNIWRIIKRRRITKLTAAAVIILAASFLSTHWFPGEQEQPKIAEITKSPVEMMTAISLEHAFRRGGIEAVENQCEQTLKLLGSRTASLSSQELLNEFNGS
ncbi:MAG TPA: hypothetical protein VMW72_13725 [Sedimentisphaerales bacterium]|nr:hypothetical protein [Sedimentisphaerales bacterium]